MSDRHFRIVLGAWVGSVLLICIIGAVVGERVRQNQVEGCERGNAIKVEQNERAQELTTLVGITEAVVAAAAKNPDNARSVAIQTAPARLAELQFGTVELVRCDEAIRQPLGFRWISDVFE